MRLILPLSTPVKKWNFPRTSILVIAGISLIAETQASIPPTPYLLKRTVAKRSQMKSTEFRSTLTGSVGTLSVVTKVEPRAETITTRVFDSAGREVGSSTRSLRDTSKLSPQDSRSAWILFSTQAETLQRSLTEGGLQPNSKLARVPSNSGIQIAWVLGTAPGLTLWIEKDTFQPLRLETASLKITYGTTKTLATGASAPAVVTVERDQQVVLTETLDETTPSGTPPSAGAPNDPPISSEVHEFAKLFLNYLR